MKPILLTTLLVCLTAAASAAPPAHPFFEKDEVHEIRLQFSQPDWWEQLNKSYGEFGGDDIPYLDASFSWRDVRMERVGVRFKGFGSFLCTNGPKKPFRIKLNEFTKGQKIGGLASYNLNNNCGDPSYVRERPYYEIGKAAGALTPRHNYAALYINGEYWGLYTLVEVPNADWLVQTLGSSETGNLYKGDPTGTFEDLGDDAVRYKTNYEKKTNEKADDWSDLMDLIAVLNRTPIEELPARIEKLLDVDSVLSALATDAITLNLDSYRGSGHNYYIYRRASDSRFQWIMWDGNLAFGGFGFEHNNEGLHAMPIDWTAENYRAEWKRPMASRLLAVPEYRARYRAMVRRAIANAADPFLVSERARALRAMIRPWVMKENNVLYPFESFESAMDIDQWVVSESSLYAAGMPTYAPALQPMIDGRAKGLRKQVEDQ